MKIIHLLILMLAFNCTNEQVTLLTANSIAKKTIIRPLKESIENAAVNSIETYISADVNRRLFGHIFFNHRKKEYLSTTTANADFLKHKPLMFNQVDIKKHFITGTSNNTLNSIAEITGSILDTFLQQYTTQK